MTFIARIARFIFWLLILSWSVALFRSVLGWMLRGAIPASQGTPRSAGTSVPAPEVGNARRLVRDPVCGVHVAEALAIPLRDGKEVAHFCSIACRDTYVGSARKFAANG
jgi:hypothetical protein